MAVIEYDEYKQKLLALEPTLGELEKALGIPKAREELAQLQKETEQEGFWNDLERSQQVSRQVKRLENKIKKHDKLVSEWEDTLTLCEMAQEEDDPSQLEEVTGKKWSDEKFKKVTGFSCRSSRAWLAATGCAKYVPSPFNGFDLLNHMAVMVTARGKSTAADAMETLLKEYEDNHKNGCP